MITGKTSKPEEIRVDLSGVKDEKNLESKRRNSTKKSPPRSNYIKTKLSAGEVTVLQKALHDHVTQELRDEKESLLGKLNSTDFFIIFYRRKRGT